MLNRIPGFTRTTALVGAGAMLAVPVVMLISAPAHADVERQGKCGGGVYEFNVDREGRGFEVDGGLEFVKPNSKWRITVKHDGNRVFRDVIRTDYEGELDVDVYPPNTAGQDRFKFKAKKIGGTAKCVSVITVG